jgi:hypothetical protein
LVLCVVVALYAVGVIWMRALARFPVPERLLGKGDQFANSEGSAVGNPRAVSPGG